MCYFEFYRTAIIINRLLNGFHYISKAVILIGHLILVAGPCSPTVYTTQTELAGLNLKHGKIARGKVATMVLMCVLNGTAVEV